MWVNSLVVGNCGILPTVIVNGALVLVQVSRDQVGCAAWHGGPPPEHHSPQHQAPRHPAPRH